MNRMRIGATPRAAAFYPPKRIMSSVSPRFSAGSHIVPPHQMTLDVFNLWFDAVHHIIDAAMSAANNMYAFMTVLAPSPPEQERAPSVFVPVFLSKLPGEWGLSQHETNRLLGITGQDAQALKWNPQTPLPSIANLAAEQLLGVFARIRQINRLKPQESTLPFMKMPIPEKPFCGVSSLNYLLRAVGPDEVAARIRDVYQYWDEALKTKNAAASVI